MPWGCDNCSPRQRVSLVSLDNGDYRGAISVISLHDDRVVGGGGGGREGVWSSEGVTNVIETCRAQ